jgi:nicotinamide-nucleotide amidase
MDAEFAALSRAVGLALHERQWRLATAESCTGGWAAQVVTHTPGSSAWFERGFITYSNESKIELLDANTVTLTHFGAVSVEIAAEMALGALAHSHADVALSITGIAGPGGGSSSKPVGTVCFGWCVRGQAPVTCRQTFDGDREAIRRAAVRHALSTLHTELQTSQ